MKISQVFQRTNTLYTGILTPTVSFKPLRSRSYGLECPGNWIPFPAGEGDISLLQCPGRLTFNWYRVVLIRDKGIGGKNDPHLLPRLRMRGTISPLSLGTVLNY
jgi:hypothetical protein